MPILPALQPLFAMIARSQPAPADLPVGELRQRTHAAMECLITGFYDDIEPVAVEEDHGVPVSDGSIAVRIYAPETSAGPLPRTLN